VVFPQNMRIDVMKYVMWCRAAELIKGTSEDPGAAMVLSPSSTLSGDPASSSAGVEHSSAAEDGVPPSAVGSQVSTRRFSRSGLRPRAPRVLN
jgi:hypothetical protein